MGSDMGAVVAERQFGRQRPVRAQWLGSLLCRDARRQSPTTGVAPAPAGHEARHPAEHAGSRPIARLPSKPATPISSQELGPEQAAALEGNPDVSLVKGLNTLLAYVSVNATMPPFDNPDARQALRYAINYDNIITLLGGNGELVQEIIPIGYAGHVGNNPFTQDLEKAKELFAKAGVTEGTVIPFTVATGTAPGGVDWATIAASIQADLAQIGINSGNPADAAVGTAHQVPRAGTADAAHELGT